MKKFITTTLFTTALLASLIGFASPDHDHGAPTFQPKKNGKLESTHNNHFEIARNGNVLSLYAYDKDGKDLTTDKIKIVGTELELPKKKKAEIAFKDMKSHWEANLDWQGAHRVTVIVKVFDGKENDNVKFTFENK